MSRKTEELPSSARHILIYDEDWEYLKFNYGPGGPKAELGVSRAIRAIIHQRIKGMKELERQAMDKPQPQVRGLP